VNRLHDIPWCVGALCEKGKCPVTRLHDIPWCVGALCEKGMWGANRYVNM